MTPGVYYLYILAADVAAIRSAIMPKFESGAPNYVDRFDRNGIQMVRSNGRGIPLLSQKPQNQASLTDGFWTIPKTTPLPSGLVVHPDTHRPGHFLLCPNRDLAMARYCALLTGFATRGEYIKKI